MTNEFLHPTRHGGGLGDVTRLEIGLSTTSARTSATSLLQREQLVRAQVPVVV